MKSNLVRQRIIMIFICALWTCLLAYSAFAWKPTTHMYTANVIMEDARDGKVTIPPYGEFEISESAKQILDKPAFYRAGSIGPDAFPDLWTGQSYIHPKTQAWVLHMWDKAIEYDDPEVWAFTYGFYLHIVGDSWCHDWVNEYAGGSFPYAAEFQADMEKSTLNVMRHMAIENTLDIEREKAEKLQATKIAIPREFVLQEMILYPELRPEMNPMIQALTDLYDEKKPYEKDRTLGIRTYNARWFTDIDVGLRKYVEANERCWKQIVEDDKDTVVSLEDNIGGWADDNLFSMLGAPDIVVDVANAPGKVLGALADGVSALLRLAGIDIDVLRAIKEKFVSALMKSTIGISKEEFSEMLRAEVNTQLFPDKQDVITQEIGSIPTQAMWPHGPSEVVMDDAEAAAYVDTVAINGPLYNSVILGKITLLKPEEFKRLVYAVQTEEDVEPATDLPDNVMLENWLVGIDFSHQCQWAREEREPGIQFMGNPYPQESTVCQRIFKSYPPIYDPPRETPALE